MYSRLIKNITKTKLETQRLILRPITIKDLRKIYEMRSKKFVFNMFRTEDELNYKSHIKWFKERKSC